MYSSICMVYMPIFIYSSCPALLRVELEKKTRALFSRKRARFFFLCLFVLFCICWFTLTDRRGKRNMTQSKSFPHLCLWS